MRSISEPFGLPNGVYVERFGGCIFKWILVVGWEPTGSQEPARWKVNVRVPGPYYNKQTVGYRIQDTNNRIQDTGYIGYRMQDTRYIGYRMQDESRSFAAWWPLFGGAGGLVMLQL